MDSLLDFVESPIFDFFNYDRRYSDTNLPHESLRASPIGPSFFLIRSVAAFLLGFLAMLKTPSPRSGQLKTLPIVSHL
jgi:hypothetical protein